MFFALFMPLSPLLSRHPVADTHVSHCSLAPVHNGAYSEVGASIQGQAEVWSIVYLTEFLHHFLDGLSGLGRELQVQQYLLAESVTAKK